MKLGRRVCWIIAASMLVVVLSGCEEVEEDEEISTTGPNSPVIVGPWVTCDEPPLCNEYLTYDLQAWDKIFDSCRGDSFDGRACPSDYNRSCLIEYDDRDDFERRILYGDDDQISSFEFARLCSEFGGV